MKKITLTFLLLITIAFTYAQLSEDFSSGVPPTGWSIDANSANWSVYNGGVGAGTAPKARFNWQPRFTGTSRLISPQINLTGALTAVVISFDHFYDYYGGAYTYGVATRSGGGAWNTVWTATNVDVTENRSIAITNGDVGQADFQMCFFMTGDTYNINDIIIDNVSVTIPVISDIELLPLTMVPYASAGNVDINSSFKNLGLTTVTSIDVNYQINGGAVVTETLTGLNVALTQTYNHTFATPWAATSGDYNVDVWISNVNGNGADGTPGNDMKSMGMSIATQSTQNLPLYEEFTSSTCGPCAGFNTNSFNDAFLAANAGNYSLIKYQMNWPGAGDAYYTAEGGIRRGYYSVSGVPTLVLDGVDDNPNFFQNPGQLQPVLNQVNAKPSFFVMNTIHAIHTAANEAVVEVDIDPYLSGDFTLHVAVLEANTTGNVASNGETYFTDVMMKMVPNASGTAITFTAGTNHKETLTVSLAGTNIEEMTDLKVVTFIQHNETKDVMQSANSVATATAAVNNYVFEAVSIYPNPTTGIINIKTDREINVSFADVLGRIVYTKDNIAQDSALDISSLEKGVYVVTISDGAHRGAQKIIIE